MGDLEFMWEKHYRLRRIIAYNVAWEIASKFENQEGVVIDKQIKIDEDEKQRRVSYRTRPPLWHITSSMYNMSSSWIDKVEKDSKWCYLWAIGLSFGWTRPLKGSGWHSSSSASFSA